MPWLKLLHIVALLFWCATLVYMPALLLQECGRQRNAPSLQERAPPAPRMLFTYLATPSALLAIVSGTLLFLVYALFGGWLVVKLMAVMGMVFAHLACGWLILRLEQGYMAWMNTVAAGLAVFAPLCMLTVLTMVLAKPFD
ncbi:CopD family protein [Litchfieldella xinjiangensis]|uniref:CopD family protein n=1 Tax=Litchfieldella xinjiangensis TaxID=1166948 RepID=UPI0005B8C211|nr:CopD family protein [Halomonas xinjiangensis]